MKHSRQEKLRQQEAYRRFVEHRPPNMPSDFTHRDYKRVVGYAKLAFVTGYNNGMNDICNPDRISDNKRPK